MKIYMFEKVIDHGYGDEIPSKPVFFKDREKALQYMEHQVEKEYRNAKKLQKEAAEQGEEYEVFIFRHSDNSIELREPSYRTWFSVEEYNVVE